MKRACQEDSFGGYATPERAHTRAALSYAPNRGLAGSATGSQRSRAGLLPSAPAGLSTTPPSLQTPLQWFFMPEFDVVGVGLNATDTLLIVPHFPAYAGKVPFQEEVVSPGGQVASALVACARLGLRTKYIGTVGDDDRGRIQMESLRGAGIDVDHVQLRKNCANQSAYIIIERSTGERTVL